MLIRMVHPEWEGEFRELFTWRDEDKQNETFSKIVDGLRKEGFNDFGEVTSSISLGCAYFINHPDDGGCFNESQCKHIANAFKQLMKTDIVQDEHDRRRIGQLIGVFEKGSADYHGVRIL